MPIRGPKYVVTPGDWQQVQIDLNDLWDSLTAAINVSTGGIITNHNDLSGLQGGTAGQYYHLTASEYSSLGSLISGGAMVYPGAGIAVSTGSAWTTSIVNNSANWNTAYSWGNWAHTTLSGYGITDACPLAHKTTEDAINGLVKVNGSGTYSAVVDNSTNWNTAYSLSHAAATVGGYPLSISGQQISFGYNSTNLKLTSNTLNTIQDMATVSTPCFAGLNLGYAVSVGTTSPATAGTYTYYGIDSYGNIILYCAATGMYMWGGGTVPSVKRYISTTPGTLGSNYWQSENGSGGNIVQSVYDPNGTYTGNPSVTGYIICADEWTFLQGQNQSVCLGADVTFGTVTLDGIICTNQLVAGFFRSYLNGAYFNADGREDQKLVQTGNTGGGASDLYVYTMQNQEWSMGLDGDTWIMEGSFITGSGTSSNKRCKGYFSGILIFDSGATTLSGQHFHVVMEIMKYGSSCWWTSRSTAPIASSSLITNNSGLISGVSGNPIFKFTGEGTNDDDITFQFGKVNRELSTLLT